MLILYGKLHKVCWVQIWSTGATCDQQAHSRKDLYCLFFFDIQSNFNGSNILGTTDFFLDMGSSSQWGSIIVTGQDANGDNLETYVFSIFYNIMICWLYLLESSRWGDSNEHTQHTFSSQYKKRNLKIFLNICFLELSKEFPSVSKTSSISRGKRVIGVRVIEVLLHVVVIKRMAKLTAEERAIIRDLSCTI